MKIYIGYSDIEGCSSDVHRFSYTFGPSLWVIASSRHGLYNTDIYGMKFLKLHWHLFFLTVSSMQLIGLFSAPRSLHKNPIEVGGDPKVTQWPPWLRSPRFQSHTVPPIPHRLFNLLLNLQAAIKALGCFTVYPHWVINIFLHRHLGTVIEWNDTRPPEMIDPSTGLVSLNRPRALFCPMSTRQWFLQYFDN